MLDRLRLLRYESPITLLAIILVTIFVIGGIIFGAYKLFFDGGSLPTVGGMESDKVEVSDELRFPDELEGVKFTDEELREANAAMSDEGAYTGGFEDTSSPPESEIYMEDTKDKYVEDTSAVAQGIGPGGEMTEAQAIQYIQKEMNKIPDDGWTGIPLDAEQKQILAKIKADPKNCYPEFNSTGNFEYTKQGMSFTFYTLFVANVLMCYGDIDNYDPNIL